MSRSTEALKISAVQLMKSAKCYFWTLTFQECPESDDWAMTQFNCFATKLRKQFVGIRGLRVIEWHKTRGIHFHFIVDRRLPIDAIFRMAMPLGFGRTHVCAVNEGTAPYLAKYFELSRRYECGKRRRLWGRIGKWDNTRCKDIVFDTPFTRSYKFLSRMETLSVPRILLLKRLCSAFGEVGNWPSVVVKQWNGALAKRDHLPIRGDAWISGEV